MEDHRSFAPLSAAQTLEFIRQVQDQARQLHAALEDLRADVASTSEDIASLQGHDRKFQAALLALQGGLAKTDKQLEEVKNDSNRTGAKVRELSAGLDAAASKANLTFEEQQKAKTRMETLHGKVDDMDDKLHKLRFDLDKNFEGDRADRGEFDETVGRLFRGLEKMSAGLDEQRDAQRDLGNKTARVGDDLAHADVALKNLVGRMGDAFNDLKRLSEELDQESRRGHQLQEEHDRTKARVVQCQENGQKLHTHQQKLDEGFKQTVGNLQSAQQQLASAQQALTSQNNRLVQAQDEVARLGEAQKSSTSHMRALQERLEETHNLASAVKDGLKETNAIVLPNIMNDGATAANLNANAGVGLLPDLRSPMGLSAKNSRQGTTPRGRPALTARGDRTLLPMDL